MVPAPRLIEPLRDPFLLPVCISSGRRNKERCGTLAKIAVMTCGSAVPVQHENREERKVQAGLGNIHFRARAAEMCPGALIGDANGYHHASHHRSSRSSDRRRRLVRPWPLVLSQLSRKGWPAL